MIQIGLTTNSIWVPQINLEKVAIPSRIDALRNSGWEGTAFFFDIDETLIGACNVQNPNRLSRRMLTEVVSLTEKTKVGFISAADYPFQFERVMQPIVKVVTELGKPEITANIGFCANRGAILSVYDTQGNEIQDFRRQHVSKYGISPVHYRLLEEALNELVGNSQQIRFEARPLPPGFEGTPEFFTNRKLPPETYPPDWPLAQIAIKPFADISARVNVIHNIEKVLRGTAAEGMYEFSPGGRTTIDINRKGVSKLFGILELLRYWGIPFEPLRNFEDLNVTPVFGLGDEFFIKAREDGKPVLGGDMSMLEVPNLIALMVNLDPTTVTKLNNYYRGREESRRIFYLGSGPSATLNFLSWVNNPEDKSRTLEMPRQTKVEVSVPQSLSDFMSTAKQDGIVVITGSILTGFKFGKELPDFARFDPTLLEIIELLKNGIPIVVASGGDYEERVIPIFEALRQTLARNPNGNAPLDQQLLFYSNGGTVKARVVNEELVPVRDYIDNFGIEKSDFRMLQTALIKTAEAYMAEFRKMHQIEYPTEEARVESRFLGTQLALLPVLLDLRGWLLNKFQATLPAELREQYDTHFGGYSIDVTRRGVNKGNIITDTLEHFPGRTKIVYFGSEFYYQVDQTGKILEGLDMEIFLSPQRKKISLAIAVNSNQDIIPEHPQILPGGSGIAALNEWLKFINQYLKKTSTPQ